MYDMLNAADLKVRDADAGAALLTERLGLPEQRVDYRQGWPNHSYVSWHLRVHRWFALAPTRLQTQAHRDVDDAADPFFGGYLAALEEFQGRFRPMKTHATVLMTTRFEEVVEHLVRRGVPYRLAPWSAEMPEDRIWIGTAPDAPGYDPRYDGGLMIEILPLRTLSLPEGILDEAPALPDDVQPGTLIRITSRAFLVRDLDATLAPLRENLLWEPTSVEPFDDLGFRRATMGFSGANSAVVELVQPSVANNEVGRYLATWGPGPYAIRIAVYGLDAKVADLEARGVGCSVVPATAASPERVRVDPSEVDGAIIEFEEVVLP
jgi:hypothetical protein